MGVRLWDVKMESKPLKTFTVHEALRPKLCELYKNDCIFDKFEVGFSHDSQHLVTGSYGNNFHVLSVDGTHAVWREGAGSGRGQGRESGAGAVSSRPLVVRRARPVDE